MLNAFCVTLLFSAATTCTALDRDPVNSKLELTYSKKISEKLALAVRIKNGERAVRTLVGAMTSGGAFPIDFAPTIAPGGKYFALNQIEFVELSTPDGMKRIERAYCNVVAASTGCIAARDTGEFCGGTFTGDEQWQVFGRPPLNLALATPRAKHFASGEMAASSGPVGEFENLLICDPINKSNLASYEALISRRLMPMTPRQRATTKRVLSELKAR